MNENHVMTNSMSRLTILSILVSGILAGCIFDKPHKTWQREAAEKAYAELDGENEDVQRGAIRDYVKALVSLEKGGDPDRQFSQGRTLLMMAVVREDREMIRRLLSLDVYADVDIADADGNTPLIVACEKDYAEIAKTLISAGAKVNLQNNKGMTALMACALNGNIALFKSLITAGANQSLKDKNGCLWGNYATSGGHKDIIEIIVNAHTEKGE